MDARLSAARRLRREQLVPRGERLTKDEIDDEVVGAGGLSYDDTMSVPTLNQFKKLTTETFRCASPVLTIKRIPAQEVEFLGQKTGGFYAYGPEASTILTGDVLELEGRGDDDSVTLARVMSVDWSSRRPNTARLILDL